MIHREGKPTLIVAGLMCLSVLIGAHLITAHTVLITTLWIFCVAIMLFLGHFFRNPRRIPPEMPENGVLCPADGKVVVIEEAEENEYLKTRCIQVSIFMSPLNVHVNRNPVSGIVDYVKHHKGKYLVAWHPKSSTENERTTTVYRIKDTKILIRQIAGAMARRIVNYLSAGDQVDRSHEMGFIKFGSRVDVFLPLDAEVTVKIDQRVVGGIDVLAKVKL